MHTAGGGRAGKREEEERKGVKSTKVGAGLGRREGLGNGGGGAGLESEKVGGVENRAGRWVDGK